MESNNNPVPPETPTSKTTTPDVPPSPTPAINLSEPAKSSKPLIWCLAILATVGIVAAAVFAYLYFTTPTTPAPNDDQSSTTPTTTDTTEEEEKYKLSDYVSFSETSVPVTFPDEAQKGHTQDTVTKIELNNLPQTIITRFNEEQEKLINGDDNPYLIMRKNESDAFINKDVLSVYTIYKYDSVYGDYGDAATLNYNLSTEQELSNRELSNIYNVTGEKIYSAILNQLIKNVTVDSFLLNTQGDVEGPTISLKDFSSKISDYEKTLKEKFDLIKIYIDKDNKMHVLYKQSQILEALGMGTHMGFGLSPEVQDVSL